MDTPKIQNQHQFKKRSRPYILKADDGTILEKGYELIEGFKYPMRIKAKGLAAAWSRYQQYFGMYDKNMIEHED